VLNSLLIAGTFAISNHSGSSYSSGITLLIQPHLTASVADIVLSSNNTSDAMRLPIIYGNVNVELPSGDYIVFIKGTIKCASGEQYTKSTRLK